MLVSVQVCSGVKVIRNWGVLSVNSDSTLGDVFHGICTGQLDSPDGFRFEEQYADYPVSCSIASTQVGKFQSISLCVSVQDAVEFGKYLKFVLQYRTVGPTTSRNALDVLMNEAGRLMWPDTYDLPRKNNRQQLQNDIIRFLRDKKLGWAKENVLSAGKPFVTQLGDILWRLDGHHGKLAAQQCTIPSVLHFEGYNIPESYKQKRPSLRSEDVARMSQTLFGILQQVCCTFCICVCTLWGCVVV